MVKHEIRSCNVAGVVSSLHCVDPSLESKKRSVSSRLWRVRVNSECKIDSIEFQLVSLKEFAFSIWNLLARRINFVLPL